MCRVALLVALTTAIAVPALAQDAVPALPISTTQRAVPAVPAVPAAMVRPTVAVHNCTEGGCHATQRSYKVLHGPTALGACDVCHIPVDPAQHTFRLKQQGQALCDFCHVSREVGADVHKPVADGQCLSCHNPHGGSTRAVLRKDNVADLCASCHGDITQHRQYVHGPVSAGSCMACHNAHKSDHKYLLVAEGRDLCLGCHEQMRTQLASAAYTHKPVQGDCQQCHEVHASDQPMQLKQPTVALCESCHQDIKNTVASATHKHDAVTEGQACINCHTPHGGDRAMLMKSDPVAACLNCHDKSITETTATGSRVVASVAEVKDKSMSLHGPIREGNCAGCHTVHGGDQSRLLTKPYPETFYESFDVNKYALCFSCHDKQLVLLPKTTGLTQFRNGDLNLHYLHVNKEDRGRSCRACHATHASAHPLHVRDSVPYGKWEMPINFKQTSTGGSCSPGCHKEQSYDRDHPVQYATPTTQGVASR